MRVDHPTVKMSDVRAVEVLAKTPAKCALALDFSPKNAFPSN